MNSLSCGYNTYCGISGLLQGACPDGWHIPSEAEATDLESKSFLSLTSVKGWGSDDLSVYEGDDTYGLSFVGSGSKSGSEFKFLGEDAFVWANIADNEQRYLVVNAKENKALVHDGFDSYALYLSVRCVKD